MIVTCELLETEYAFLERENMKFVSMLKAPSTYSSCYIDFSKYIDDASKYLVAKGAKRPGVVSRGYRINPIVAEPFVSQLKKLDSSLDYRDYYLMTYSFEDSRNTAINLLSRPEDKRPDALIFTGDVVMQGVVAWLTRLQKDKQDKYMPMATAMLNKQNPIMPVLEDTTIFELDIYGQTKVAIESLLHGIRSKRPVKTHAIAAKLVSLEKYFENSIAPDDIND